MRCRLSIKNDLPESYILVGADPNSKNKRNPGGQITASEGLVKYCAEFLKKEIYIIDTTQGSFPVASMLKRLTSSVQRLRQLIVLLKSKKIVGVIIFSSAGFSFYEKSVMSIICNLFNTPNILFIRSGFFLDQVSSNKLQRITAKLLLRIPTFVGGQGSSWKELFLSLGISSEKICIVRNWLNPDFKFSKIKIPKTNSEPIKFVFVGWLVTEKGVDNLVEAAEIIPSAYPFKLQIIGGGTLEESLKNKIIENDLSDKVNLTGWMNSDEVAKELFTSDVFILPSMAEGFPNALIEAMSAGLPCIASDVGGISDSLINGVNGYLLQGISPKDISDAMIRYIENPYLINTHSQQAINTVSNNHDWESNCKNLFDIFT